MARIATLLVSALVALQSTANAQPSLQKMPPPRLREKVDACVVTVRKESEAPYTTVKSSFNAYITSDGGIKFFGTPLEHFLFEKCMNDSVYHAVNPCPAGSAVSSSTSPRRDLMRQVQERLQAVGYNPGTIDGSMGPQTQQALRWFQNAQGLRATGDLDEYTLNALGIR
jgi:hypothetical protein